MNRKERRDLKRTLASNGVPKQKAESYIIAYETVRGRNHNPVFKNGDAVKLKTKSILEKRDTSSLSANYVKFITENKDKVFHVVRLEKYPGGEIVGLLENDLYYFYSGDLMKIKE